MNTKLIKQLESVGFESSMIESFLKIGKYSFNYYHSLDDFSGYDVDGEIIDGTSGRCEYIHPTFEEIIAAVKKHTGIDLQSKQTQRKEVVCFSKKMEDRLRENDNKGGWKACSNSRLLTGLKNNVSKLDTVIDANTLLDVANYAMMLFDNNMILVNYFEDKPKQTKAQRIEALEQGNQSLAEQVEELRAKQQGFEALLKALNEKVSESESSQTPTPKVEDEPKLKMGAWAEVLGHSGFFRKGEKVLIISKLDEDGEYWCINKDKATEYHKPENLKPL